MTQAAGDSRIGSSSRSTTETHKQAMNHIFVAQKRPQCQGKAALPRAPASTSAFATDMDEGAAVGVPCGSLR